MRTLWIDRGELVCMGHEEHCPNYPFEEDNADVPLRHYGLVRLCENGRRVQLTWDVAEAHRGSIEKAIDAIRGSAGRIVELRYFKSGWAREAFRDKGEAERRVAEIAAYADVEILPQTIVEELTLDSIYESDPIIRSTYEAWRRADFLETMRASSLDQFAVTFSRRKRADPLKFTAIGQRSGTWMAFGRKETERAIGQSCNWPLGGGPFDNRVAETYNQVLQDWHPRYQHILGNMTANGVRSWWPYQRLVVPVRAADGQDRIFSTTKVTRQSAIPFMAG